MAKLRALFGIEMRLVAFDVKALGTNFYLHSLRANCKKMHNCFY